MKFVARSSDEAEQRARAFVREHCARKGYVMHDEIALADVASNVPSERRPVQREPRFVRALPIRYGTGRPVAAGTTGNLSETGMFVVTPHPAAEGDQLGLVLQLEHCQVPLRGSVVWRRPFPGPARPAGMGLRLLAPPKVYRRYVTQLD
jgi:hypothetical protein